MCTQQVQRAIILLLISLHIPHTDSDSDLTCYRMSYNPCTCVNNASVLICRLNSDVTATRSEACSVKVVQQMLNMPFAKLAQSVTANDVETHKGFHLTQHQHCAICQLPTVHDI